MSLEKLEQADAPTAVRAALASVRFPMVPIKVSDGLTFSLTQEAIDQLVEALAKGGPK